ncbi:MAG: thiamine phosphate synthase [Limnochordales bacterium]|nr:thiamine phosphate synthase [Limnochordales bacterium]
MAQPVDAGPGRHRDLRSRLAVYLLTDPELAAATGRSVVETARAAIAGGVTALQLRAKALPAHRQWELGLELRRLTRAAGIPFFVNDRVDLALALEADGVHLGEEDIPVAAARRLAQAQGRPDFIIGFSTAVLELARQAVADGADYVSVGDLFGTTRKPDAGAPIGTAPLAAMARSVDVPVIGIGGITAATAAQVIEAGACGVAVISCIAASPDPAGAARELAQVVAAALARGRAAPGAGAGREAGRR